jgi:hypothetical protein
LPIDDLYRRLSDGQTLVEIGAAYGVSNWTVQNFITRRLPPGCQITTYAKTIDASPRRCRQPLAAGARFCAKHEADRVRLGGGQ